MDTDTVEAARHGIGGNNPPSPLTVSQIAAYLRDTESPLLAKRDALLSAMERFRITYAGPGGRGLVIPDVDHHASSGDFVKQIRVALSLQAEHFKKAKEPFLSGGRVVDSFFRAISEPLKAAYNEIETARKVFAANEVEKERARRQDIARIARQAADTTIAALHADDPLVTIDDAIDASAAADKAQQAASAKSADLLRTRGDLGSVSSLKDVWDVELVDLGAVPCEYLLFDHAKALRDVRGEAKVREIPGCRVFVRQDLVTR